MASSKAATQQAASWVDDARHLNALAHIPEMLLVAPEQVWPETLLVHKGARCGDWDKKVDRTPLFIPTRHRPTAAITT